MTTLRLISVPVATVSSIPVTLQFPPRAPADVDDHVIDWTSWLADSLDTIASVSLAVTGDSVTITQQSFTPTQVTFWPSGGTDGTTCGVTCTITTAGGRTVQRSFGLPCANQFALGTSPTQTTVSQQTDIAIGAGTATVVSVGGLAVVAIQGPVNGGIITNPATLADQGIAALETIYVSPVAPPGATDGSGSGTAVALVPGQSWQLPGPIGSTSSVWVNAATAGHKFAVITW